jgi:UDP-N-acetylmuramate dehydrogenase
MCGKFAEKLRKKIRGEIRENEPMDAHTSFGIGGPADIWVKPQTRDDLFALLDLCKTENFPFLIIGYGTNLLVRDGGIRGVIANLDNACGHLELNDFGVAAGAAVSLNAMARFAANHGFHGLEFCIGIPGSLGGGLVSNAGAWGESLGDRLRGVLVYEPGAQKTRTLEKDEICFDYRKSDIASHGVILEAEFSLERQDAEIIEKRMKQYLVQRTESQPVGFKCAGSVFKNPPGGYAGALIDALDFKGYMCGDAMVSDVHANFILNVGSATAADVLAIIAEIKRRAHEATGIELEEEIIIVGKD